MKFKIDKFLAVDCETSGLAYGVLDPTTREDGRQYQAVSWGILVVDSNLKIIDQLYVEVRYNGTALWSNDAQAIHGLSPEYLEENGVSEEEAAAQIASLILKHWGVDTPVNLLGHNVSTFDCFFLKRLLYKYDLPVRFANRHLDSFSAGFITLGITTSDELFEYIGVEERGEHNALEDIYNTVKALKSIRSLWKTLIKDLQKAT